MGFTGGRLVRVAWFPQRGPARLRGATTRRGVSAVADNLELTTSQREGAAWRWGRLGRKIVFQVFGAPHLGNGRRVRRVRQIR